MKIDKIVTSTIEQEAQFIGMTLLSKEEYKLYAENIPAVNFWWWLRSPGNLSNRASIVGIVGCLDDYGNVYDTIGSVRPALFLNPLFSSLEVGDKFKFYNHNWTMIANEYALCDEAFCKMKFRKNRQEENANIYNTSGIKEYLDSEWAKMKDDKEQPTVDIVPIVRCKDCMFWHDDGIITTCDVNIGHGFAKNWFCADGKRKEK